MEGQSPEVHVDSDQARAGSTPNIVRWILAISLLAVIVAMSAIWITGAATHENEPESEVAAAAENVQADQGGDTDGVLLQGTDDYPTSDQPATEPDDSTPLKTVDNQT